MKLKWISITFVLFSIFLLSCQTETGSDTAWPYSLYLGNQGFWQQRVQVDIQNNTGLVLKGDPVAIEVGKGKGKIPLAGALAQSVRVTNSKGDQLLYRLDDPQGKLIEKGSIPKGSIMTIPLENGKGDNSTYLIYFENPEAWPVGEYFYTHQEVSNGGFEKSGAHGPLDWELEWPEEKRDISWTETQSHTGNYSLEVSSERKGGRGSYGAEQSDLHLIPGATYEIEAWFKTENLEGEAGLILLPGNLGRTKRNLDLDPVHLKAASDSEEWTRTAIEFTAPSASNTLRINTFINGPGKLWVDDVQLTSKEDYDLDVQVRPVEKNPVKESGVTKEWLGNGETGGSTWPIRAKVSVPNFTPENLADYPVYVDIQMLSQRLFAETDESTVLQLTDGTNPIPYLKMGNAIMFKQDIAAQTYHNFYLYFSDESKTGPAPETETYGNLSQITENLVHNSTFDQEDIAVWQRFGEGTTRTINPHKENGNSNVQISFKESEEDTKTLVSDIEISHTDAGAEMGLFQEMGVNPGGSYFFSAMVKCSNILDRTFTLRAGFFDETGELIGKEETLQANPDMHQNMEWVQNTMIIEAPSEASTVKVELMNTVPGEVWYDEVYFMEIGLGYSGAMAVERKAEGDIEGIEVWEKSPVAKAFPDDLPDSELESLKMSAAKNDVEPVQILMRSQQEHPDLEIVLSPLKDENGNTLDEIEIGLVGYVMINYPSNYYRDFETPFWRTKIPVGKIGSDGWTGWWADPILPFNSFSLSANETKAAWIEVAVPEDATAGIYSGQIELLSKGEVIKKIPLEMQVYDFTLPEAASVKATYVPRFNNREMFGRDLTAQEWNYKLWKYMAKHRISPETINPQPTYSVKDGEVVLDFTEFDKAADVYFEEMKFTSTWTPRDLFYLFGWGHPPSVKFGEKPYPGEAPYHDADHSQLRPEYKRKYQSALRQYWDHMKENGWADKVVIYISDEPHADPEMKAQVKAVCDMIHEVDPAIPIYISTWWYRPEFEGYVDVWGVSHRGGGWGHPVPAEHLEQAVNNGGEVYFTTDGMQCTDSPYLGFERMLPYFCFKYGASEYEFWASNWHTLDPYQYGWHKWHRQSPSADVWYWMRYPNGDGNFIYPGEPLGVDELVSSVRLKQAREGVEDYEFMHLLEQMIKNSSSKGVSTAKAQKALNRALDLVSIPCADGRYTTDYMPDPDVLMEIRHEVATAIEELKTK